MTNGTDKLNPMFLHLVLSLQSAAWYQMGKTVSPISGKIERDLDQARASIDMLVMLKEKTTGNLSEEEKKILENTVYTLQMNFVDEQKKGETEPVADSKDDPAAESGSQKSDDGPGPNSEATQESAESENPSDASPDK